MIFIVQYTYKNVNCHGCNGYMDKQPCLLVGLQYMYLYKRK